MPDIGVRGAIFNFMKEKQTTVLSDDDSSLTIATFTMIRSILFNCTGIIVKGEMLLNFFYFLLLLFFFNLKKLRKVKSQTGKIERGKCLLLFWVKVKQGFRQVLFPPFSQTKI